MNRQRLFQLRLILLIVVASVIGSIPCAPFASDTYFLSVLLQLSLGMIGYRAGFSSAAIVHLDDRLPNDAGEGSHFDRSS